MSNYNLEKNILDNGLKLECVNQSKEVVNNIYYICITIRVMVPVEEKWFKAINLGLISFDEVKKKLGPQIIFEQKYEKHFVKKSLKQESIDLIIDNFLSSHKKYIENSKFPGKFILKTFYQKKLNKD